MIIWFHTFIFRNWFQKLTNQVYIETNGLFSQSITIVTRFHKNHKVIHSKRNNYNTNFSLMLRKISLQSNNNLETVKGKQSMIWHVCFVVGKVNNICVECLMWIYVLYVLERHNHHVDDLESFWIGLLLKIFPKKSAKNVKKSQFNKTSIIVFTNNQ